MPSVAEALRQHLPAYYAKFGLDVPIGHRKVLNLIARCKTGELGDVILQCQSCQREHWVGRSCGNRHCPNCGAHKTAQWLAKQSAKLLPVHHFLVTCTVPREVGFVLRAHPTVGYPLLFAVGSQTILEVAARSRYLKDCQLGFFGALHTWGRDPLVYHPHVHFVVPGGGVSNDDERWCSTPTNFFLPHAILCQVYKAKFADALREAALYDQVPVEAWSKKWVIDVEPVGTGRAVLKYLAPYVHRVAISNKRIVACDEHSVTYQYTPSKTQQVKQRRVTGEQFIQGFTQHILPRGFQKVRYYGWQSTNSRLSIKEVQWLVCLAMGWVYWLASAFARETPPKPLRCPACGGPLKIVQVTLGEPSRRALPQHALSYLDSG